MLADDLNWTAAIVVTEPNEKRIYKLEELPIYKPEECSRITELYQNIGREDYDGNYEYAVCGLWNHLGPKDYHVGGVRLKLYDESKSLVAVKYFRFDEKNTHLAIDLPFSSRPTAQRSSPRNWRQESISQRLPPMQTSTRPSKSNTSRPSHCFPIR